jgi:hypothetical protein
MRASEGLADDANPRSGTPLQSNRREQNNIVGLKRVCFAALTKRGQCDRLRVNAVIMMMMTDWRE